MHSYGTKKKIIKLISGLIFLLIIPNALATGIVKELQTKGTAPTDRDSLGIAAIKNNIYLFGGTFDNFNTQKVTCYNDLYRFDTRTNTWQKLSPSGTEPPPRGFSSAFAYPKKGLVFVFGGASFSSLREKGEQPFKEMKMFNDLWAYSIDENKWTQIKANNDGPPPRGKPVGWITGDKIYIFGGVNSIWDTLNDLWSYDIKTNTWSELIPNNAEGSPPSRQEAQGGLVPNRNGTLAVIYGGEKINGADKKFTILNDTWEYNMKTNKWRDITPPADKNIFPIHTYSNSALIGNYLFIQSGDLQGTGSTSGCGAPFPQSVGDDLWRFDLTKHVWERIGAGGDPLPRMKRSAAVDANNKMYMFLGYDFICPMDGKSGQIWIKKVYMYDPYHKAQ